MRSLREIGVAVFVVLVVLLAAMLPARADEAAAQKALAFDQVDRIELSLNSGWFLSIYPLGQAELVYGAGPGVIRAPRGTFSFREVYDAFAEDVAARTSQPGKAGVGFERIGQKGGSIATTRKEALVRELVNRARAFSEEDPTVPCLLDLGSLVPSLAK